MNLCFNCGNPIPRNPKQTDKEHAARKYCSQKCASVYRGFKERATRSRKAGNKTWGKVGQYP